MSNINKFLFFKMNGKDYCLFFDKKILLKHFTTLQTINFNFDSVIVDRLFDVGDNEKRFVIFEVKNGIVDLGSSEIFSLDEDSKIKLDNFLLKKFSLECRELLGENDFEQFSLKRA